MAASEISGVRVDDIADGKAAGSHLRGRPAQSGDPAGTAEQQSKNPAPTFFNNV